MSSAPSSACLGTAGRVVRAAAGGRVEVELEAPQGCRGCEGICAWRRLPPTRRATFATPLALEVGDRVMVSLPASMLLMGAAIAYGVPLVLLLGGALAGWAVTATDLGGIGGAAAALVAVPLLTLRIRRRVEQRMLGRLTLTPAIR
jgi:positive regulator of sigma E activity